MATISFTASAFPGPAAAGSVYGVACFDAARPVPVRTSPAPKRRARENSGFRQRPTLPGGLPPSTIGAGGLDRKSTRLNSSHVKTSYAVFCLKKKTTQKKEHIH